MSDDTKTYPCFLYRQRADAPLQIAFVAPSSEIDGWARVPTKQTGNVRNFQRAEIPQHVKEVQRFFQDKHNASPTAVVIGFDPVRARDRVALRRATGEEIDPHEVPAGAPLLATLQLTWVPDPDDQDAEAIAHGITSRAARVRDYIFAELAEVTPIRSGRAR